MPPASYIGRLQSGREIVVCDSETAGRSHQMLFHFTDEAYLTVADGEDAFGFILEIVAFCNSEGSNCPSKIHMALNWENLLRVTQWSAEKPAAGNVFILLKNVGIGAQDLQPFKNTDINDIFPALYYGRRFDILRKICHAAKRQAESRFRKYAVRVDVHVIADDANRIVASSL